MASKLEILDKYKNYDFSDIIISPEYWKQDVELYKALDKENADRIV